MTFITVECSCKPDLEYADGNKPSYYIDEKKAAYMYNKLRSKARIDHTKVQAGDPRELKEFNMYFGVHLNGGHIISIKP